MAMCLLLLRFHAVLGGGYSTAFYFFKGDGGPNLKRMNCASDGFLIRAGIRQSAHQHIAADSGKRIQIAG